MCHVMPTMIFRNIGTAHINFELCHRGGVKFRFQIHEAGHRLQYFVDCPIKRLKRERASHYHKASVVSIVSKPLGAEWVEFHLTARDAICYSAGTAMGLYLRAFQFAIRIYSIRFVMRID